ncbi:MAG: DUF4112 domain-containing protein [Halolamina sp.]
MEPATRLERSRRVADLMDSAVAVPIVGSVGLDGIIGVLPVAGDWVTGLAGLYIVYQGYRIGLPTVSVLWMLLVVAVDATAGSVPVVGDALDIAWKSNQRNVARIEQHLDAA